MRELLAILFPYLVLLYLFDCVASVRSGHLLYVSHLGRRFRLKREGAHLVGLLPTGQAVVSHDIPLFLSAAGVHLPASASCPDRVTGARDTRFLPWRDIVSAASEGPDVLINGAPSVALPSEPAAAAAAAAIRDLAACPPARRPAMADALLAESFDLRGIERLRETLAAPLRAVSIASTLMFVSLYAVLPLALFARPLQGRNVTPLALAAGLAYVLAIAAALAAARSIDPRDAPGRARMVLLMILLPPGAAHVLRPLTRDLFARYDHLAVAAALLPLDDFRRLARKELARAAFRRTAPENGDLADCLRARERAVRRLVADAGLDADRILAPPLKASAGSERYCPACEVEYLGGADRCADCGIPLADFGDVPRPAAGNAGQESACANSSPG